MGPVIYQPLGKSGLKVSNIGVGCAGLSGLHGPADEEQAKEAIRYALKCGVNLLDTAPYYNNRTAELLLKDILGEFDRAELCVCTKVGRFMDPEAGTERFDYSARATKESVYQSLKCMELSYIDLIQIHDVEFAPSLQTLIEETIPCLVELKKQGVVKAIGVTGYSTKHIRKVVESCMDDIDVVMSYFRHNLFDGSLAADLPFYRNNNIGVINASPLAIGLLTNRGNVPKWNPAPENVKKACKAAAEYCVEKGVDLARLAIRHSVEASEITVTLWSSRKVKNMKANITSAILPLTNEEETTLEYVKSDLFAEIRDCHWEEKLDKYHNFWPL